MKPVVDYVHGLGLKMGIYTAVSNATCGGFSSSLNHEAVDAQTFADWGMDFVKHDTCNEDCGIHDGCIQNSTGRMRDGLNATGKPIVYYIDDGNDSSGMRMWNPNLHRTDPQLMVKIALKPSELIWNWGPSTANMWKLWFDHHDHWYSTLDNVHHMIGLEMFQECGGYNTPDMVTIGQGALSPGMYRAQMFLWSIFGSPIILGNDLRIIDRDTVALVTAPEVLAVDQDPQCVQGSLVRQEAGGELWARPLADGTFAVVMFNTSPTPLNMTLTLNGDKNYGDLYPALVDSVLIRDIYAQTDLGVYSDSFSLIVDGQDAVILKLTPQE